MDHRPSIELLEAHHSFPGVYHIKAIGSVDDDFQSRVVEAVQAEVGTDVKVEHSARTTAGGRHVAVTLDIPVESADQVRSLYGRIQEVKGLHLLL